MNKKRRTAIRGFSMLAFGLCLMFVASATQVDVAHGAVNLVPNPSLEVADPANSSRPSSWSLGRWGTNSIVASYPVAGLNSARAARIDMTSRTSGDAKWWFNEVPVKPNKTYRFSNAYKSTTTTWITVQFRMTDGSLRWMDLGSLPAASTWRTTSFSFETPSGVSKMTVFHLINRIGSLTIDNYNLEEKGGLVSINLDDGKRETHQTVMPILNAAGFKSTIYPVIRYFGFPGYISRQDLMSAQSSGHEIGSHTRTHSDLTAMSLSEARAEIAGSVQDLKNMGVADVRTFAYPFGGYNQNIENIIKDAGLIMARTSNGGYNNPSTSRYLLNRKGISRTTTVAEVKGWIDQAVANDQWLILVLHNVDLNNEHYSMTPQNFQEVVNYLKQKGVTVMTNYDAARKVYNL